MFDRRLKVLIVSLGVGLLVIVGRLGQLQIVHGDYYRRQAERSLILRPVSLPFVRGSIVDRRGEVLARDEPSWALTVDYGVLATDVRDDPEVLRRQSRRWSRAGGSVSPSTDEEAALAFREQLASMWTDIARFMAGIRPVSVNTLRDRAREIHRRIEGIRAAVAARRGFDAPVAEERTSHALVTDLDSTQQIAARGLLARYPWVRLEPVASRRLTDNAAPFSHVIGRLGRVTSAHVSADPRADDPFARYRADERVGITGVEYLAEQTLRGCRGQLTRDREGHAILDDSIAAEDGRDVSLTLHAGLQRRLYDALARTVEEVEASPGGAIVVLDVRTRQVLAMVSYPSYDGNRFHELYPTLRNDTDRLPLRFRAVSNRYAPGSTIKPLVCIAGLMNGRIALDEREECTGYLFPDVKDRWRCWQIHGTTQRKAHGLVEVVGALTGSCNVYMYRLGERLGVDGLCSAFDMVGIGKPSGIGLREEVWGINPTPGWLMEHKNTRATPGTARLFAIGQGELAMTPLQVANLMATYASGRWRPVTLIRTETEGPEWTIPATPEQWAAVRLGVYGVVNDPDGTAYRYAHFNDPNWALCGKTGSATAHRWPTSYRIPYVDEDGGENIALVPAGARQPAIDRFIAQHPAATFEPSRVEVAGRWPPQAPPPGERYSHAWFGGYLQKLDAGGQPDWTETPRIAFAALVEFGGGGGPTCGPLAKRIVEALLDVFGPTLNVDL